MNGIMSVRGIETIYITIHSVPIKEAKNGFADQRNERNKSFDKTFDHLASRERISLEHLADDLREEGFILVESRPETPASREIFFMQFIPQSKSNSIGIRGNGKLTQIKKKTIAFSEVYYDEYRNELQLFFDGTYLPKDAKARYKLRVVDGFLQFVNRS